jgi:hypothetical protein
MMTEKEARTKWCPFMRAFEIHSADVGGAWAGAAAINTDKAVDECRCIASECMMWRIETDADNQKMEWTGYCGLAGKP